MPRLDTVERINKEMVLRWANQIDQNRERLEWYVNLRTWEHTGASVLALMTETSDFLRAYANQWMEDVLPESGEIQSPVEVSRIWAHDLTQIYAGTEYGLPLDKLVQMGLQFCAAPTGLKTDGQRRNHLARALRKQGWTKKHRKIKQTSGYFWYPPLDVEPYLKDIPDYTATGELKEGQLRIIGGQLSISKDVA